MPAAAAAAAASAESNARAAAVPVKARGAVPVFDSAARELEVQGVAEGGDGGWLVAGDAAMAIALAVGATTAAADSPPLAMMVGPVADRTRLKRCGRGWTAWSSVAAATAAA